jgi:UDP:flavonoid glycosyltransferase YjiC (YdhE family)
LKVVIATWDAGGVTQPAIGLGRLMAERGHDVRVLAPVSLTDRIMAAGARPRAWPPGIEFDASRGRAIEEQLDGWLTANSLPSLRTWSWSTICSVLH